ncbi:TolC family outer membrane protein [Aquabacterium sp. A7-Y]|uniref:TolC family outer membrane protein n=1 Tax=Aquabacterium sp. A7-Y TaxID=1349605 RepID=UPI00223D207C|nr:TolC family outer membrane protein [Aquabacterium sp. A7-Y]MCW7538264.1 TolC family outer membrane protein [Aquabacterium sp. A7-Y]
MSEPVSQPFRRSVRRRPARLVLSLGIAALFASGGAVQAQSLAEVYQAARDYDATYLAARAQAESVRYQAEQAYALRRPKAELNAAYTRSENETASGIDRSNRSTQVGVGARQPLFNRANGATIEQAERSLQVATAELQEAEQDLIVRVADAYFQVLAAQDALAAAQANKKAISEQLASAKRNFEVGTATITDTREAQARFDLATAQEIAADNDLRTKQIALDQLVGRTGVSPRPLPGSVALPPVQPANVEEWVAQTDNAPTVRRARLGLEIAELETDKARAGHLPTVDLVGQAGRNRLRGDPQSALPGASGLGTSKSASVGVELKLPLFAGFAVQNRVKETLLLEERSRNDLDAARRGVAQGTRQAFFGVQSKLAQVKALEAAEASSQLALEATQLGYKVGVRVNLDVLNAQTQLFNTRRDLAQARYDVLVNSLRLRQAAGVLVPEDVTPINGLLTP